MCFRQEYGSCLILNLPRLSTRGGSEICVENAKKRDQIEQYVKLPPKCVPFCGNFSSTATYTHQGRVEGPKFRRNHMI